MKVTCDLAFFFSFFLKERGRSRCSEYQMFFLACGGMPICRRQVNTSWAAGKVSGTQGNQWYLIAGLTAGELLKG